jgi:hypothetical protein
MANLQKAFIETGSVEDATNILRVLYRQLIFDKRVEINYSKFQELDLGKYQVTENAKQFNVLFKPNEDE